MNSTVTGEPIAPLTGPAGNAYTLEPVTSTPLERSWAELAVARRESRVSLVGILRHAARPGPRDCDDLRGLLPAPRAAHSLRKLLERHLPADQASECLGLDLTTAAALTNHAHQELTETIVELLDLSEYPHPRMVWMAEAVAGDTNCAARSTSPSATLYFTYLTVAENTSSIASPVLQPGLGTSWSRLSVQMGCETPP